MWLQQESKVRVWFQCASLGAAALSTLAVAVGILIFLRAATRTVAAVPEQIAETRTVLADRVDTLTDAVSYQIQLTRDGLLEQASGVRGDTKAELEAYRKTADARLGDTLQRVDTALGDLTALRQDAEPVLKNAADITAHADEASAILFRRDALPAQVLGVTAAAKIALGETAQTMRVVQQDAPAITANIKTATDESAKASQKTAEVMQHFAQVTKPLPLWVRIGLAVAPPLANTAAGVASVLALTGRLP